MNNLQLVVCPHCLAQNRVPSARLGDDPKCGKCHRPLFTGHPLELNAADFEKHVRQSDIPLLVDFWAPWCGPCRMMAPQFEQAAKLLEPKVRLAKINTENEQALAAQFQIRSIPALKLFVNGREAASQAGAMDASGITRWVNGFL